MFTAFERMVAGRYLRARKAEGFVSVIAVFSFTGILLGVATLIIVMSVMNGFRAELFNRILGLNGHLNIYASGGPLDDYEQLVGQAKGVKGVTAVAPLIESQALVSANGIATGAMIRGLLPADFAAKKMVSDGVIQGKLSGFTGDQVAIGLEMAKRLNLSVGDSLTLIAPKGKAGPFGTIPRTRAYTVGLIFDVGMFEYNNGFVFMPLDAARVFFQVPDGAVNFLEVMTEDPARIDQVKADMSLIMKGQAGVYDWRDANTSFVGALDVERNVMFLILFLIILVAAFNIISTMIMLVRDKSRGIAIMRTMGATQSSMMKIFVLAGGSIGFAGTLFGAILGILFAVNIESIRHFFEYMLEANLFPAEIYFFSKLPAKIDWTEVVTVIVMALALSIGATLIPARRAARLDPVEALRYE